MSTTSTAVMNTHVHTLAHTRTRMLFYSSTYKHGYSTNWPFGFILLLVCLRGHSKYSEKIRKSQGLKPGGHMFYPALFLLMSVGIRGCSYQVHPTTALIINGKALFYGQNITFYSIWKTLCKFFCTFVI